MKEDDDQNFVAVLSDFNGIGSAYIFTQNLEDVGLHHVTVEAHLVWFETVSPIAFNLDILILPPEYKAPVATKIDVFAESVSINGLLKMSISPPIQLPNPDS